MNVLKWIIKLNPWLVVLLTLFLKLTLNYFFHLIASYYEIDANRTDDFTLFEEVIALIILAPIIETLIFQFGIQELLISVTKKYKYHIPLSILVSSITFSLTHSINLFFITIALISGLIYSALYLIIKEKAKKKSIAFAMTSVTHVLNNFFEFVRYGDF